MFIGYRHPGSGSVPAVFDQKIPAFFESLDDIEFRNTTKRSLAGRLPFRHHAGRLIEFIGDATRDETDDTVREVLVHGKNKFLIGIFLKSDGPDFIGHRQTDFLSSDIVRVKLKGEQARFSPISFHQKIMCQHRVRHPRSGIDARGDLKPDHPHVGLCIIINLYITHGKHLLESHSTRLLEHDQSVFHDDTILTDKRHHISHRPDRHDVENPLELFFCFRRKAHTKRLSDFPARPGATQLAKRVGFSGKFRIDDSERFRQDFGHVMMIDDDDIDAALLGFADFGVISHPTVKRHGELHSLTLKKINGVQM